MSTINPYDILISNKGILKINKIELAELKDLEIKITPETKEIGLMNSATKGEVNVSYKGTITFELNKVYSRFKPAVLSACKNLIPFTFDLESTVYSPTSSSSEESISIKDCWFKGDITLFALKSDNDFLTEKYEAGFKIENANFDESINDDYTWESTTSTS